MIIIDDDVCGGGGGAEDDDHNYLRKVTLFDKAIFCLLGTVQHGQKS
jgi:hypothetical protein